MYFSNFISDCGLPSSPDNGVVLLIDGGTTFGANATQVCNPAYELSGKSSITCDVNGSWSDPPVTCSLKGIERN